MCGKDEVRKGREGGFVLEFRISSLGWKRKGEGRVCFRKSRKELYFEHYLQVKYCMHTS